MRTFVASSVALALAGAVSGTECPSGVCETDETGLLQVGIGQHIKDASAPGGSDHPSDGTSAPGCGKGFTVFPYGKKGASLWATNYDGWQKCGGHGQSPINIVPHSAQAGDNKALQVTYHTNQEPLSLGNNGHALGVDGHWGTLDVPDVGKFATANIHFHHPSEHTVYGLHAELEMHIVHTVPDTDHYHGWFQGSDRFAPPGSLAVVGILFDVGNEDNVCLQNIFDKPAPIAGCQHPVDDFDLSECFAEQLAGGWLSYNGSLTTPPCTEGVYWHVMEKRAKISQAQLDTFKARYYLNARPTQPLHGRVVTRHSPHGEAAEEPPAAPQEKPASEPEEAADEPEEPEEAADEPAAKPAAKRALHKKKCRGSAC